MSKFVEQYKNDEMFMSKVANKFCMDKPSQIIFKSFSPKEFFETIFIQKKDFFENCRAIIDPQDALRPSSPLEITKAFHDFVIEKKLDYDGVLYFKKDKIYYHSIKFNTTKEIEGDDVVSAFSKWGLKWDQSKVLVLFDPSHTTAANIPLPDNAEALFLIAENLTLDDQIQAKLRLRQYLLSHKIVIGMAEYLVHALPKDNLGNITPETILMWTIKNLAQKIEKTLIESAYQQIDYFLRSILKDDLKHHINNPEKQIEIFSKHKKGIFKNYHIDPYNRFSDAIINTDTKIALLEYAKKEYQQYGFSIPWNKSIESKIYLIIQMFIDLVQSFPSSVEKPPEQESQLQLMNMQLMDQEKVCSKIHHLTPVQPTNQVSSPYSDDFLKSLLIASKPIQSVFKTNGLTKDLYITDNAINTASSLGKNLGKKYLKAADFFVVCLEWSEMGVGEFSNLKKSAFILSPEEAGMIKEELSHSFKHETISGKREILFINYDGRVIRIASPYFETHPKQQEEFLKTQWMKDIVTDLNLIQGRFYHKKSIQKRIEDGWSDFFIFWKNITKYHPQSSKIQPLPTNIERI
ncbi:MAG: hypothetical protein Q8K60_08665 [Parachlamydiaceae bacterium]|nr:hypothetical protein [Parachlamydiaceae bacterium]